ncbi:uncharacterized protein DDB_G0283357-like [Mercenaria mercenaria]|uniref:uncharacterized protein DDB_G0283357-like n=1 Tax=Mercenaria mercenaria TaxID=6596 RepID=UPI00234F648E|nr:uncharacterized protein DDB_G0283357-like [Mercenaria mercenaria]
MKSMWFQIAVVYAILGAIEATWESFGRYPSYQHHTSHSKDSHGSKSSKHFFNKGSRTSNSNHDWNHGNILNKGHTFNNGNTWNKGSILNNGNAGNKVNTWTHGNIWNKVNTWNNGNGNGEKGSDSHDKSSKGPMTSSRNFGNSRHTSHSGTQSGKGMFHSWADKFKGIGNTWLRSKIDQYKNKYTDMKKSPEIPPATNHDENSTEEESKSSEHQESEQSSSKVKTHKSEKDKSHKTDMESSAGSKDSGKSKHDDKSKSKSAKSDKSKTGSKKSDHSSHKSKESKEKSKHDDKSKSKTGSKKSDHSSHKSKEPEEKVSQKSSHSASRPSSHKSSSKDKSENSKSKESSKSSLKSKSLEKEKSKMTKQTSSSHSKGIQWPPKDESKSLPWPPKDKSQGNQWPPKSKSKPFPWPPKEKSQGFPRPPKNESKQFPWPPKDRSQGFPWPPKDKSKQFPWPPKDKSQGFPWPPKDKSKQFPWPPNSRSNDSKEQSDEKSTNSSLPKDDNNKSVPPRENKTDNFPNKSEEKSNGNLPFPPRSSKESVPFQPNESGSTKEKSSIEPKSEEEELPRFGPTLKPPYKKPKVCKKVTPSCCVGGAVTIDLNKARGKQSKTGSVDGVSVLGIEKGQGHNKKHACSSSALIMVDFDKIDNTGCFRCLEAPYCGKRMLKIELKLSNGKRNGWLFNVGDSDSNNGYRGDSDDQMNDAETQALFPNITVYPSDKCPTINSLMHIVNAVGHHVETVTLYISNEHIKITNDDGLNFKLCHKCLYALNGQPDSGPNRGPNERICIGLNRVVKDLSRTGYGICSATFSWECPWCN